MARTKDFDEQEVLQKAVSLFWNKGYNGTSMQDLVLGLGISRSSLYDTYGDKYQLYLNALNSYKNDYGIRLQHLGSESPSARTAVVQILSLVINDLLNDEKRRGCFMVNAGIELASHDTNVNNLVCATAQQLEQAFFNVIVKGQTNGEISNDKDALALARFFNNTVRGMQVSAKSGGERSLYDDIIRVAVMVLD